MIEAGFLREDEREGLFTTLVGDGCGVVAQICRISFEVLNEIDEARFQRGV
jgi:hypothetical protein